MKPWKKILIIVGCFFAPLLIYASLVSGVLMDCFVASVFLHKYHSVCDAAEEASYKMRVERQIAHSTVCIDDTTYVSTPQMSLSGDHYVVTFRVTNQSRATVTRIDLVVSYSSDDGFIGYNTVQHVASLKPGATSNFTITLPDKSPYLGCYARYAKVRCYTTPEGGP